MSRLLQTPGASVAVLVGTVLAVVVFCSPAGAARKGEEQGSSYVIENRHLADQLTDARDLVTQQEYDEAEEILDSIRLVRIDPYPLGLVHQLYAYVAAGREDYPKATEHFRKALATEALPPPQMSSMRFNLAQIQMATEQWEEAIETLEAWFEQEQNPSSAAYYMLGIAYYQADDLESALEPAQRAVELSDDPQEPWVQLLISLHVSAKRYDEALPLLERLALRYPKKAYWMQLAAVHMELGNDEDSLAVQQLADAQGFLEEDRELTRLAQMHLFMGLPWQGGERLRESLEEGSVEPDAEAWALLANSLLAARENDMALEPLTRAARLAEDGNTYVRLCQVYMQREQWDDASDAIASAFEKGDLDNPAYAHLLVGITAFQRQNLEGALVAFARALEDGRTRKMAQTWIQFVERAAAAAQAASRQG